MSVKKNSSSFIGCVGVIVLVLAFIGGALKGGNSGCAIYCGACGSKLRECANGNLLACVQGIGNCHKCGKGIRGIADIFVPRAILDTRIHPRTGVVVQGFFRGNNLVAGSSVGQAMVARYPNGDFWQFPGLRPMPVQ